MTLINGIEILTDQTCLANQMRSRGAAGENLVRDAGIRGSNRPLSGSGANKAYGAVGGLPGVAEAQALSPI